MCDVWEFTQFGEFLWFLVTLAFILVLGCRFWFWTNLTWKKRSVPEKHALAGTCSNFCYNYQIKTAYLVWEKPNWRCNYSFVVWGRVSLHMTVARAPKITIAESLPNWLSFRDRRLRSEDARNDQGRHPISFSVIVCICIHAILLITLQFASSPLSPLLCEWTNSASVAPRVAVWRTRPLSHSVTSVLCKCSCMQQHGV